MLVPLQITFRNLDASPAARQRITDRVAKLDELYSRIASCRVVVRTANRRQQKGRLFNVRIDLKVPGREIVINRDPVAHHANEDIYVAIHQAFDALERRLEDFARRRRGDVKARIAATAA